MPNDLLLSEEKFRIEALSIKDLSQPVGIIFPHSLEGNFGDLAPVRNRFISGGGRSFKLGSGVNVAMDIGQI